MRHKLVIKEINVQHPSALPGQLWEWTPGDPQSFQVRIGVWVGPEDEEDPDYHPGMNERYYFWICTPEFLLRYPQRRGYLWGRYYLVLHRWDFALLRSILDDLCAQAANLDLEEQYAYLGRFMEWESETTFGTVGLAQDPLDKPFTDFFEAEGRPDLLFHNATIQSLVEELNDVSLGYMLFAGLRDPRVRRFWQEIPDRHWREIPSLETGPFVRRARASVAQEERERILQDPNVVTFLGAIQRSLEDEA